MLNHIDIFILTETKLVESLVVSLFLMDGFSKPCRLDRNENRGGIIVFMRDGM